MSRLAGTDTLQMPNLQRTMARIVDDKSLHATHEGRDRMLDDPRRIAPILLASLVGLIAAGAVARAEPAAAASSSAGADCLAKPSAPSAPGNHWYYRVDRASGRHCWYERPTIGATPDASQSRSSTRAIVSRADSAKPDVAAERLSAPREQDSDQTIVAPAAAAPA